MQAVPPVRRHASRRSRGGLIQRVVVGRDQDRAVERLLCLVVPEPVLAGLIALGGRMADLRSMVARMPRWRRITAPDVAAPRAASQMEPPATGGEALRATGPAWWCRWIDVLIAGHHVLQ